MEMNDKERLLKIEKLKKQRNNAFKKACLAQLKAKKAEDIFWKWEHLAGRLSVDIEKLSAPENRKYWENFRTKRNGNGR